MMEEEGQTKEKCQVAQQLDALEGGLEKLHDRLSRLEGRLSSVLRAEPEAKSAEEPKQDLVPLADRIRAYVMSVDTAAAKLNDVLERLEL